MTEEEFQELEAEFKRLRAAESEPRPDRESVPILA